MKPTESIGLKTMTNNIMISLVLAMIFLVEHLQHVTHLKRLGYKIFGFLRETFKLHTQIDHQQPVKMPLKLLNKTNNRTCE